MKMTFFNRISFLVALVSLFTNLQLRAQPAAPADAADITPQNVLDVMQRVADWQLAHPSDHKPLDWTQATGYAGFMALAGISSNPKYRDAMLDMGKANDWQLGPRKFHADDHCVGQTYAELYFLYRDPKMIAPLRARFDDILANPSTTMSLQFNQPNHKERELWSWCDSLFMGPPTWMRLYAATGDPKYMDFAVTNWWYTTDYLYDKDAHLFYRDSTYFNKKEANGQKVFWGRGNGWVMAGLVRVLQYLPMNSPDRPRFEQLFKDMAPAVVACQQPDGLWHASMLDPGSYPLKETSGSSFFVYALAWGINQGLLDRATYEPVVDKAWLALVGCVDSDGKLTNVQPMGADPKSYAPDSTEVYGVGGFLLAGSEVYRMLALEKPSVKVTVTNPSSFYRSCETVDLDVADILKAFSPEKPLPKKMYEAPHYLQRVTAMPVIDAVSSRVFDSQTYVEPNFPWKKIFQVDLAPGETRTFFILDESNLPAAPQPIVKTFARYVPERHEDIAWESDRIAHRMYGPALETWAAEPLISSGYDVWVKRTRDLIVNWMYATMFPYDLNGPAQDDYKVGKLRGCGGLGIWNDGTLYVSKNWRSYKIITTGPIRSEFELTYDAWDAGGRKVSETKRMSIDAGSNMTRVESTFDSDDNSPLQVAVGLNERPGDHVFLNAPNFDTPEAMESQKPNAWQQIGTWQNDTARGLVVRDQADGWQTYWQPQDFSKGVIGVAFILPNVDFFTNDFPDLPESKTAAPTHTLTEGQPAIRDLLGVASVEIGKPFVYYTGAGWSESGDFPDAKSWNDYVSRFAERWHQPLQVTVGN